MNLSELKESMAKNDYDLRRTIINIYANDPFLAFDLFTNPETNQFIKRNFSVYKYGLKDTIKRITEMIQYRLKYAIDIGVDIDHKKIIANNPVLIALKNMLN